MRMRQVVGGVWGVLIQVVGVGKWAFLAISGLGELEKLKHCHNPTHLGRILLIQEAARPFRHQPQFAFPKPRENYPPTQTATRNPPIPHAPMHHL